MSAPSSRTLPDMAGQMPTSRRASVDFPAALGPITATASPGANEKLTPFKMATLEPGAEATTPSTESCPSGAGNDMFSLSAGNWFSIFSSRSNAPRAEINCFQEPINCSTGARVRPIRIDPAIIAPGVNSPLITSRAPMPRIRDCCPRRMNLLTAVIVPARSLATDCMASRSL